MFNEYSPLFLTKPKQENFLSNSEQPTEISSEKLQQLLKKFHYFPDKARKKIWSYVLQLPNNVEEAKKFRQKAPLPQVKALCEQKGASEQAFRLANALVHWHAPLINCEWLPCMAQKLTFAFPNSPTFCFEVVIVLLTNVFSEWLADIPGPPPEVLSRIDAILSYDAPSFRDALGSGLVAWPAYRSIFSDILYDRPWLELMDYILLSEPQFVEYTVIAWLELNEAQLRYDHETFNSSQRPVSVPILIKKAIEVYNRAPKSTHIYHQFKPLTGKFYPLVEGSSDAVVLRTLESDQDRLSSLQAQLAKERKEADDAELIKLRKQQTFDSIEKIHERKATEEKLQTSRAAAELEKQMRFIRLESIRLKQSEETQFIDQWKHEWERKMDFSTRSLQSKLVKTREDEDDNSDDAITIMTNLREGDNLLRESRRVSVSRGKQTRSEIEAQVHQRSVHNEVNKLATNPELLTETKVVIKSTKQ